MNTTECAAHHFGPWLVYADWFAQAVDAVKSGMMVPRAATDEPKPLSYELQGDVAFVRLEGPLMKIRSKFGGTSTVDARAALRAAVRDPSVRSIVLLIDSPGGTMAGTEALANEVAKADRIKPVYAHIQDLGASAAYYVASQARRITAEPTSLVGSLGVVMTVVDESKSAEMQGLRVINLSSGGMKGAGTPGTEVTEQQLAYFQGLVNDATRHFKSAVRRGRGFTEDVVDALFDGRVHDAADAKSLRLIDDVLYVDQLVQEIQTMNREEFIQYGREHPDVAAEFIGKGHSAGRAEGVQEERARVLAILRAFGVADAVALEAVGNGTDAEVAQKIAEARAAEQGKAAALAAENAELRRKLELATSGQVAVAFTSEPPAKADDKPTSDPASIAEWEWEHEKPKGFSSKERYIAWRRAELAGIARRLARA